MSDVRRIKIAQAQAQMILAAQEQANAAVARVNELATVVLAGHGITERVHIQLEPPDTLIVRPFGLVQGGESFNDGAR